MHLFTFKSSTIKQIHLHIALNDILLVPPITKNLLSISKLTYDNNLSVEFLGNIYDMKDSLKGEVLLKGIAEKSLLRLLLKLSSSFKSSPSSFLSHIISNKPLPVQSSCHFNFVTDVNNADLKSCYQSTTSPCKTLVNKITLFHTRLGYPN